jgi:hypothetical protein
MCQKPEPGKQITTFELRLSKHTLWNNKMPKIVLGAKVCKIGRNGPSSLEKFAEIAPEHWILEEKVNNGPWEFTSYHIWSLGEKFEEITSLVLELSKFGSFGPWD